MTRVFTTTVLLAIIFYAGGCARDNRIPLKPAPPSAKDYGRPLPPGGVALRKIEDPARLPDFRRAFPSDTTNLLAATEKSLRYLGHASSKKYFPMQGITHTDAMDSLARFRDVLTMSRSAQEFHQRITSLFDVYESVGCDGRGTVLFTGYYTPIFDARLARTEEYRWPLHRLPPDLAKGSPGEVLGRRLADGTINPEYYTRGDIDAGALKGQELVYLKDRFEAYICTIQGSAHLRLGDGRMLRIGYSGDNGRPYTSVGKLLIADGLLPRDRLSLSGLIAFFRERPSLLAQYLPRNKRYVFFQATSTPPTGSLGAPVTPYRSLATDKSIYPRGCLTLVDTAIPRAISGGKILDRPFLQFMLDQDTGGAIRAPGRADIYLGIGEGAGQIAGWMFREGHLYYLFLKK